MRPRTLELWHAIHKWTSLVCTAFALLLCVTGLPLTFVHELDRALGRTVAAPADEAPRRVGAIDRMLADAHARRPGDVVQFLSQDDDDPGLWYVRLAAEPRAERASAVYAYAASGRFLAAYPLEGGVMNAILRLHVDLFAGPWGTLFLGVMGLVLVASIVSGVVLYGPYMKRLAFGALRRRSRRLLWLDVHDLVGIVTLGWFTVVSATGVVNAFAGPIFGRWQATELAAMLAAADSAPGAGASARRVPEPGAEAVIAAALAEEPDTELGFAAFPGTAFAGPHHYVAFLRGNTPWRAKLLRPVLVDARDGGVVAKGELPLYVRALLVSQPLHFGDYGGLPLKLLWVLFDLGSIVLLGSGLYLWIAKRDRSFAARRAALEATR